MGTHAARPSTLWGFSQVLVDERALRGSELIRVFPLEERNPRFQEITGMVSRDNEMIRDLREIVSASRDRVATLQKAADLIRSSGGYRWTGIYDVGASVVTNVVWSGVGAPEYPAFAVTKGLTGAAIASRKTVNVGDVSADPRYLTAFGTTKSEIIVPVFDSRHERVVGTIDVESERANSFGKETESLLEDCAEVIRRLWR